jgi:hypothetical protein
MYLFHIININNLLEKVSGKDSPAGQFNNNKFAMKDHIYCL